MDSNYSLSSDMEEVVAVSVDIQAGGTMQQQHSTGNDMTENGGGGTSAINPSGGSVIQGIARIFIALFLSLFFPQSVNNTAAVVDDDPTTWGGSSRACTWLRRKFYAIWLLLLTRDINPLKTGSLALSLISFFVDHHHLSHEDNTYLEVALWCGVFAFLVAPWSVPNVHAPRLAKTRQATAVLALIVGVLIAIATAVDIKKLRTEFYNKV